MVILRLWIAMICFCFLFPASALAADQVRARNELNAIRGQVGLPALGTNPSLIRAAQSQAESMARKGKMSHTLGGSLRSRVRAAGFGGIAGENLGVGQPTVSRVIIDWMKSPGHRRNILNGAYTCFGMGEAMGSGNRRYWALILGRC